MTINFPTDPPHRKRRNISVPRLDSGMHDHIDEDQKLMDLLFERELAYLLAHPGLALEEELPDLGDVLREIICLRLLLHSRNSILEREKAFQNLLLKLFQVLPFEDD